jgi:hypothetical protein
MGIVSGRRCRREKIVEDPQGIGQPAWTILPGRYFGEGAGNVFGSRFAILKRHLACLG